jgi:hypothetical protein
MQRYLRCDCGYGYVTTAEPVMAALWEQQAD